MAIGARALIQSDSGAADGSEFAVLRDGQDGRLIEAGVVNWPLIGRHNVMNALAALAAAEAGGVDIVKAIAALANFRSAKRRMELVGEAAGIKVYDDFAHHPTAIATTLAGLRARVGSAHPRWHGATLQFDASWCTCRRTCTSFVDADGVVFLHRTELVWDAEKVTTLLHGRGHTATTVDALIAVLREQARPGDHVVFMSNGGFENAPRRFLASLPAA